VHKKAAGGAFRFSIVLHLRTKKPGQSLRRETTFRHVTISSHVCFVKSLRSHGGDCNAFILIAYINFGTLIYLAQSLPSLAFTIDRSEGDHINVYEP
jgi:hypothetical protein